MGGPDKESHVGKENHLYIGPDKFIRNRKQSEAGISNKEGEKLIQSQGKWTVAYVSTYEKNKHWF